MITQSDREELKKVIEESNFDWYKEAHEDIQNRILEVIDTGFPLLRHPGNAKALQEEETDALDEFTWMFYMEEIKTHVEKECPELLPLIWQITEYPEPTTGRDIRD